MAEFKKTKFDLGAMEKTLEQKRHLNSWVQNGGTGSCIAATGLGKTRIGLMAIEHVFKDKSTRNALIIVPNENLRDNEWPNEFTKWKMKPYLKDVEIMCIHSAYKLANNHYDIVVVDEAHTTLSGEYGKFYDNNSWDNLMCLTATPPENAEYRQFLKEIAPVCSQTDLKSAVKMGLVSPYIIYNVGINFTPAEKIEYDRVDNLFKLCTVKLGGQWTAFTNATKWKNSSDKEQAKWANMFYAMMQKRKKLCYNASNKLVVTDHILRKFVDRKALVFSESIEFAQKLQDRIGDECVTFHSKMSKKEREETLQRFGDNRTKARVISSVKALNQGLNVPECSLGICAAGSSMKLDNIQRTGRTLRLQEGKISLYINLFIKGSQEVKWVRKRCLNDPNVHWVDSLDDVIV